MGGGAAKTEREEKWITSLPVWENKRTVVNRTDIEKILGDKKQMRSV